MTDHKLSELLLDLYACPLQPSRWGDVLDRIRNRLEVRSTAVQLLARRSDRIEVRWVARDRESEAIAGHHNPFICGDANPRLHCRVRAPRSAGLTFMRDSDFARIGETGPLKRLHDALRHLGLGAFLSNNIGISPSESLVLVMHRDVNDCRVFSAADEAFVTAVMPHLRQALVLSQELESKAASLRGLQAAADHVSLGIALCDDESHPTWYNSTAGAIFSSRECLWINRGRLSGADPADTDRIRDLVAKAAAAQSSPANLTEHCLLLGRASGRPALQMVAAPFTTGPNGIERTVPRPGVHTRVLLFFSSPSNKAVLRTEVVGRLFALSPAESRLTVALCSGQSVNDYASTQGVAVGTVRFQLKQVLAKTQARRQSELVGQICMSVVAHAMRAHG